MIGITFCPTFVSESCACELAEASHLTLGHFCTWPCGILCPPAKRDDYHFPYGSSLSHDLPAGHPVTLGCADDNAAHIDHDTVSRHHARLHTGENGGCMSENLHTANGQAVERFDLQDGDHLAFGLVAAVYHFAEADAARMVPSETVVGEVFADRYWVDDALGETDEYRHFLATDLTSASCRMVPRIFELGVVPQASDFEQIERQQFAPGAFFVIILDHPKCSCVHRLPRAEPIKSCRYPPRLEM